MTRPAGLGGWRLFEATDGDLDELMSWFRDSAAVDIWGGPRFRFPFTRATFRKDCHWGRMPSFRLNSPAGEFAAFGISGKFAQRFMALFASHPPLPERIAALQAPR